MAAVESVGSIGVSSVGCMVVETLGCAIRCNVLLFQYPRVSLKAANDLRKTSLDFCQSPSARRLNQVYIAQELSIVSDEMATRIIDETKQLNRMLRALAKTQLAKVTNKS